MSLSTGPQLDFANFSQPSEPRNSDNFYLLYPYLSSSYLTIFEMDAMGDHTLQSYKKQKPTGAGPRSNKPPKVTRSWSLNKLPEVLLISLKEKQVGNFCKKMHFCLITCIFFFHFLSGISRQDCNGIHSASKKGIVFNHNSLPELFGA